MSHSVATILVVDDDPGLLKLVGRALQLEGFRVLTASDGRTALRLIEGQKPTLVLLDVMMPGMNGFEVCERARDFCQTPIIMLTAKGETEDVVCGLNRGADDYIRKPFGTDELVARINAVLRRSMPPEGAPQQPFVNGDLCIHFSRNEVTLKGHEVVLTPTEYRVLRLLAGNPGRVITQELLLSEVWGSECSGRTHMLQVTMARLRKKLDDDPANPRYIVTRSGIGYVFRKPQEPSAPAGLKQIFPGGASHPTRASSFQVSSPCHHHPNAN